MSLHRRRQDLAAAQAAHRAQVAATTAAGRRLRAEIENGLTPGRVLGAGLLGGLLAGWAAPSAKASSPGLPGRLLRLLLDGAFDNLRAAIAAGAAMAQAEDETARTSGRGDDA